MILTSNTMATMLVISPICLRQTIWRTLTKWFAYGQGRTKTLILYFTWTIHKFQKTINYIQIHLYFNSFRSSKQIYRKKFFIVFFYLLQPTCSGTARNLKAYIFFELLANHQRTFALFQAGTHQGIHQVLNENSYHGVHDRPLDVIDGTSTVKLRSTWFQLQVLSR